ncbi:MAG: lectin [Phreatobacter sp.]|jgi:hypothetical protein|nr:lectin [Phreatobacter sp.]
MTLILKIALAGACATAVMAGPAAAQQAPMGFFITSAPLDGGNLGGLAGADRHCQALAAAAGAGNRTWRAYLSTQGAGAVNARDRIGAGPWANARGVVIAASVAELHGTNNLTKQTALTEAGAVVNGRGDTPNQHDILTGSQADGTAFSGDADRTCGNWTKNGEGSAMVGHHDRMGLNTEPPALSWNTSHPSRGCDMPSLRATGGDGRFYCFAAN